MRIIGRRRKVEKMSEKITAVCEICGSKVEECVFANYKTIIDGQEYLFCCKMCAERFLSERKVVK